MTLQDAEKRSGLPYSVLERFVSLGIIRKSSMPDEYQEKDFGRLGLADILLNAGYCWTIFIKISGFLTALII